MTELNRKLYDEWSATYDEVENPTRDLEAKACRELLGAIGLGRVLELGCGTGKNTAWLAENADRVTAVDLSPEMQAAARSRVTAGNVDFKIADLAGDWGLGEERFETVTASLVLEHIEDLNKIFENAAASLTAGGRFYICELHPFKQYAGSKARFETESGTKVLDCFVHNVSDYLDAARNNGFELERLDEWFDGGDRNSVPRLISFLFRLQ